MIIIVLLMISLTLIYVLVKEIALIYSQRIFKQSQNILSSSITEDNQVKVDHDIERKNNDSCKIYFSDKSEISSSKKTKTHNKEYDLRMHESSSTDLKLDDHRKCSVYRQLNDELDNNMFKYVKKKLLYLLYQVLTILMKVRV